MPSAVDVHVKSESASCRELADWLTQLAAHNSGAADAAIKSTSKSESIWQGEASDAFRSQLQVAGRDVDELVDAIQWLARGLRRFADDIDAVRRGMQECVQIAHQAGLSVAGTVIQKPPGSPLSTGPTGAGGDMPGLNPRSEEHEALEDKHDAYRTIEAQADDMRRLERTAHRSLAKCWDGSNGIVDALLSSPQTWISRGFVAAGTAQAAAKGLAANSKSMYAFAEMYRQQSLDPGVAPEVRAQRLEKLLNNAGMDQRAANSNKRLLLGGSSTKAGRYVLGAMAGTLGRTTSSGTMDRVGKLFNVTSVIAATGFTVADISSGKPVAKSVWANFGGLAAGTAASTASAGGMTGGGLLSIGGASVTVGSLGVGFAATTAFNYFQDHDLRDLYRDLGGDGGDRPDDKSDEYRKARHGH